MSPAINDALRREYAPHGTLRAAINHGNRVLARRDAQGAAKGITIDLARALAEALALPLTLVEMERAGDVSASASDDVWDVCFLAVDPKRAETITFTQPYIRIEGRYLAGPQTNVADFAALVDARLPVGTVEGSAYTLHLRRQPGAQALVPFARISDALSALDAGRVAAIAGIGTAMQAEAATRPGARVLHPPFMDILQAMGTPVGRPDAHAHLSAFLADLSRKGRIGAILEFHGVSAKAAVMPQAHAATGLRPPGVPF